MNIMIVFPETPVGATRHFKCGEDDVWLRCGIMGLKSLPVDTLVLLPGCSKEQKRLAIERTRMSLNPKIMEID